LVFEQELEHLTSPWMRIQPPPEGSELLAPSRLREAVGKAIPEKEVRSIWYHGTDRTAHVSLIDSDSLVYVNPYTAAVVAVVDHEDFFHFITDGHIWLWLPPEVGIVVTTWSTLVFFVLLVTGLVLWWPKKWNKVTRAASFKIKWRAKFKRLNYDLHNVLGFYSLIVAAVMAFTALMMGFAWVADGVYWVASGGHPMPEREWGGVSDTTVNKEVAETIQVDRAWIKGRTELANYHPDEIIVSFPQTPSDAIYVCTDMVAGTWRDVFLDQHTLDVLPSSKQAIPDLKFADLLFRANYGLHVGATGGMVTKIIYFLASLVCASLPITGFLVWWGKRRKKKKARKAAGPTNHSSSLSQIS